jgi:pantothenate kinase-related protein Tda10
MKIKRIHTRKKVRLNLKNGLSKYPIPTAKEDPKLPGLFVFCGSRGSGQTYACVAMEADFEKKGYITRTFLISPKDWL